MTRNQLILKWVLLLSGMFLMTAFAATFLPIRWMSVAHQWLGLGDFPDFPIVAYLARSTSLLYGVHGVVMFYTALTLDKHWRFVWLLGFLHIVSGCAMFAIDWFSPMPWFWILAEGPPVATLGVVILFLMGRADFGTWQKNEPSQELQRK